MTGDIKAVVSQNVQYKLMNTKTIEPKTMPKGLSKALSKIIGYYIS